MMRYYCLILGGLITTILFGLNYIGVIQYFGKYGSGVIAFLGLTGIAMGLTGIIGHAIKRIKQQ